MRVILWIWFITLFARFLHFYYTNLELQYFFSISVMRPDLFSVNLWEIPLFSSCDKLSCKHSENIFSRGRVSECWILKRRFWARNQLLAFRFFSLPKELFTSRCLEMDCVVCNERSLLGSALSAQNVGWWNICQENCSFGKANLSLPKVAT